MLTSISQENDTIGARHFKRLKDATIDQYEAVFHAGAFFAGAPLGLTDPPFLDLVPFRFNIADPSQHYHLPLKITPWGFSLYRGA